MKNQRQFMLVLGVLIPLLSAGCASGPKQTPEGAMADLGGIAFKSAIPNMLVSDLTEATKFYTAKLGFKQEGSGPNFVTLSRDNVTIGLIGSSSGAGKSWCYLTVSDPTRLYNDYKTLGVTIDKELQSWGQHTEFTIVDPEGNRMDIGN